MQPQQVVRVDPFTQVIDDRVLVGVELQEYEPIKVDGRVVYHVVGRTIRIFDQAVKASWIKTGDSTYRTSIYYNPVAEGVAHPVSCILVPTVKAKEPSAFPRQPQDPLGVESCWLSKNGKYLNLGLLMKNGRDSEGDETTHAISLVLDGTRQNSNNTVTACYRLLHDKRDAPEYYTNRRHISILLPTSNRPDSVELTIKTYTGNWTKTIRVK